VWLGALAGLHCFRQVQVEGFAEAIGGCHMAIVAAMLDNEEVTDILVKVCGRMPVHCNLNLKLTPRAVSSLTPH
jgi:hypothetical protein